MAKITERTDQICRDCWDKSFFAYGTSKIFTDRARLYKRKISILAYLGIAMPALIGVLVFNYGFKMDFLPLFLSIASILGIIQLLFSIVAVINDWSGSLEYCNESASENLSISDEFKNLAKQALVPPGDLKQKYEYFDSLDKSRRKQDIKKNVNEKELRKAHRYSLRMFDKKCKECNITPTSMKSSNCNICGKFKWFN